MRYADLIFDLDGTLMNIHTEENDLVWEKTDAPAVTCHFAFEGADWQQLCPLLLVLAQT